MNMPNMQFETDSLVSILYPITKNLNLVSFIVSFGLLMAIAFFVEEKKGFLTEEAIRLKAIVRLTITIWIVTIVGSIFIETANIINSGILAAFDTQVLQSFLLQTVIGRTFIFELVFAVLSLILLHQSKKVGAVYWAIAAALLSAILPVFQSHASGLANHSIAIGTLAFHLIFISIWVGGVIGLFVVSPRTRALSLMRFSSVALWCAAIVSISGAVNSYVRLNFSAAWHSAYSAFVIAKIVLTGLLIAMGAQHRKYIISKKPQATYSLLGVEAIVMVITIVVGGWLSTISPPSRTVASNKLAAPNLNRIFWAYSPDALFLGILILVSALYIRGIFQLRKRGDLWPIGRTIAFFAGVGFADYATSGGIGIYASYAFSYHMIAHMILGMIAPIGFVLSAPVTLALRTLPIGRTEDERGIRGSVISLIHAKTMAFYTNPIVVLAIFDGSLFLLYMTPLFGSLMHSHSGHFLMDLHFLLAGYLFFHVIIGVDPNPRKVPHLVRIIILFAAMSIHAFFSIALLSTSTLVDGGYFASLHRTWNTDLLLDQHLGGSIGWAMGEIPILLALIATFIQWVRDDSREAKRIDRAAERADAMGEDDELAQYNKYLARLQNLDE
jgi:putative copper resistance protein D